MTTHYVYGVGGLMLGEYTSAGAMVREYIYLNQSPLSQVNSGSPETVTYIHTDHLGTPRFGTNSAGTNVWSWTNDAFGISAASGAATINLRMPGQYFDSESSLFYNWNRYYNPMIGRYISSDPIGQVGGINTYGYAVQNPANAIDPDGLATCTYSITTHTLICVANNFDSMGPPSPLTLGPRGVFSGSGECKNDSSSECTDAKSKGPIPPNKYEMIPSDKYGGSFWLKEPLLDRRLCQLGFGRCEFFLHKGRGSAGCINANKDDKDTMIQWNQIMNLLQNEPDNTLTVEP